MGFVGFLRFSLLCFDFLAWPALALGYPLCASIRAIETSSKHHMRKLVTYWTIFSLISLFEIFFVKLIQWVPFWPYIKLVAICWLVIPQFNGACLVYQCLIHPCLSVNPQDIINWFCIQKNKPSSEESFLASAEAYLEENGPEALEKLIASKAKCKEHIHTDADALEVVKTVEPAEKNVTAEEELVEHPRPHLVESEKKEITAAKVQRLTTPAKSEEERPLETRALKKEIAAAKAQRLTTPAKSEEEKPSEIHALKKEIAAAEAQRLTTTAKSEEEKPLEIHALKKEIAAAAAQRLTTPPKSEEERPLEIHALKKEIAAAEAQRLTTPPKSEEERPLEIHAPKKEIAAAEAQRLTTPAKSEVKRPLEIHVLEKVQREWTCAMCQVTTTSEADLNSHLVGRKHWSKCEELKTSTQTARDMQSSAAKHKSEELKTSMQAANNLKPSAVKTNDSNQAKKNLIWRRIKQEHN